MIKKILLSLSLLISSLSVNSKPIDSFFSIPEEKNALLELLKIVGMEQKNAEPTLSEINAFAQANLIRKGERWEAQTDRFERLKPQLFPLLTQLGFIDSAAPLYSEYEGAIVYGALLPRVRVRLQYLIDQWENGVRFNHIYFLGGERPLQKEIETEQALLTEDLLKFKKDWKNPAQIPQTETEMMRLVWEQTEIPEEMKQVQVHFINAPMKIDPKNGQLIRPNTADTVIFWLKESPVKGKYLGVTNSPYIVRQDLVTRTLAGNGYLFDTIGPAARPHEKMIILLDELARVIFLLNENNSQ